jgi:hypothetical protein
VDPFDFDAQAHVPVEDSVPTLDDLLSSPSPAPAPTPPTFDAAPPAPMFFAPPPRPAIDLPVPAAAAAVPPPIIVAPPSSEPPDVTPTLAPAPAALPDATRFEKSPGSSRGIIASAFSALLAAEQGEPGAMPVRLVGTDEMVDDVARRVIQRLALGSSDQLSGVLKEIISDVAERLVREEIDRIRNSSRQ